MSLLIHTSLNASRFSLIYHSFLAPAPLISPLTPSHPLPPPSLPPPQEQEQYEQYEAEEGRVGPSQTDGTLRPPPQNVRRGDILLTVFIEKWGFKVRPPPVWFLHDGQRTAHWAVLSLSRSWVAACHGCLLSFICLLTWWRWRCVYMCV